MRSRSWRGRRTAETKKSLLNGWQAWGRVDGAAPGDWRRQTDNDDDGFEPVADAVIDENFGVAEGDDDDGYDDCWAGAC